MLSPGWVAWIEHVPAMSSVTDVPLTEQTAGVVDVSVTCRPELAVAVTVTGDWTKVAFGGFGKVMDCATFDTVNERGIGVAAR